jgi:hypothetical protein
MARFRVTLLGRAGSASFASKAGATVPKAGQVGPRPTDLVPSLAALIPKTPENKDKSAAQMPWVKSSENFFATWTKISPCMPKYAEFLALHKKEGLKVGQGFEQDSKRAGRQMAGKVMANEEIIAALGKFYLHVALQLRPEELEKAGSDNASLLKVAQKCAEEDFEPFVDTARELVSDYNPTLHKALEETAPWYEVDDGNDGLFWQANFDVAAPGAFQHFLTAVGHGSGQGFVDGKHTSPKEVASRIEEIREGLNSTSAAYEPARRAAKVVYEQWLDASSMPVKGDIKKILMEHGLIVSKEVYDNNVLMPEPISEAAQAS